MKIFDYTYYRVAKQYFKRDGSDSETSLHTVSLIICIYIFDLFFVIEEMFFPINRNPQGLSLLEKATVALFMYLIYCVVKKRYKGKFFFLREKWLNEPVIKKRINGIGVILFILSPFILLVVIAKIFGKLNI